MLRVNDNAALWLLYIHISEVILSINVNMDTQTTNYIIPFHLKQSHTLSVAKETILNHSRDNHHQNVQLRMILSFSTFARVVKRVVL